MIYLTKTYSLLFYALFTLSVFTGSVKTQETIGPGSESLSVERNDRNNPSPEKSGDIDKRQKYRLLQSNDFLVDTAYQQEEGEIQHSFSFRRTNGNNWSSIFTEELPLGGEKHQLTISLPAKLAGGGSEEGPGIGDMRFEYGYGLYGDNASRITVSPGIGLQLPTGNYRKGQGDGAAGLTFKFPVSIMLTDRFASNSVLETSYIKSAKNRDGYHADIFGYEVGQSFVWFAKPKLNFLVEATWERSQKIGVSGLKEIERELYISPGIRWAHSLRNGLIISPGVALPVGIGPSRGERGIFFYISFEHTFKKEK